MRILGNFVILHFQSLESNNHLYEYRIMRTMPSVTQKELHEELGISITAIQKLINQLVAMNFSTRISIRITALAFHTLFAKQK